MDRPPLDRRGQRRPAIGRRAGGVEQPAQHGIADRHQDRAPVPRARVPRRSPAVLSSATARMVVGSRCCCTSTMSGRAVSVSTRTHSSTAGRAPAGKAISTTEP